MPETIEHKKIKDIVAGVLTKLYGVSLVEFPDSEI
jgi:hypothetical protein